MLKDMSAKLGPKTVRNIKIGAAVVGAVLAAAVVGVVLYKTGLVGDVETVEEILESAVQAA